MRSNENKLSHRWRERAWLRSLILKSYKSYSSERPAVGWSDWLDDALLCSAKQSRSAAVLAPQIADRDRKENEKESRVKQDQYISECATADFMRKNIEWGIAAVAKN